MVCKKGSRNSINIRIEGVKSSKDVVVGNEIAENVASKLPGDSTPDSPLPGVKKKKKQE